MSFTNTSSEMPYKAISLFSGMGGDTLGMKNAGLNVIAYSEYIDIFRETHDANFPGCETIGKEVSSNILKITDDEFMKYIGIDFLFAGFPCQSFSTGGKRKVNDPRNTMFREFVRAAKCTNAKVIIGENVKGLLSKKTQDNVLYIDVIKNEFELLGYQVIYKVFACHKYNIPQKRERLIILGIKNEYVNNPFKLQFPDEEKDNVADLSKIVSFSMETSMKVCDSIFDFKNIPEKCILTDINNDENEQNPHPYMILKRDTENKSYHGKDFTTLFSFAKRGSPIHCEIIDIYKPCKTIICTYEHQPRLFVPLRNKNGNFIRMITPDELKQIQTFPQNYIVKGNNKNKIIQIGNAVPPLIVEKIVRKILE